MGKTLVFLFPLVAYSQILLPILKTQPNNTQFLGGSSPAMQRVNGTSQTLTTPSIHSGDLIIVSMALDSNVANTFSASDPTNGTYTQAIYYQNTKPQAIWYVFNTGASGTRTITFTSGTSGQFYASVGCFRGPTTYDTSGSIGGTAVSLTLANANEAVWAQGNNGGTALTAGAGMTLWGQGVFNTFWSSEYSVSLGSGSQNIGFSASASIIAAAFK